MMKKISVIALFCILMCCSLFFMQSITAKEPNIEWNKTFGIKTDWGQDVKQTNDGGYIITGGTYSFGSGCRIWLIKTDSNGDMKWNKTFGWHWDAGYSVQQTTDDGYIVLGTKNIGQVLNRDTVLFLIKTDSNGNERWNKTFGGDGYHWGASVRQTNDEGYILLGTTTVSDELKVWLIKTDSDGNEKWNKTFTGECKSLQISSDGGYVFAGLTNAFENGGVDGMVIKTDSNGIELWNRTYGGKDMDFIESIQLTNDGGYILVGATYSYGNNGDAWLIKTDSIGAEQWNKTYGEALFDKGNSVWQTDDYGYIMTVQKNLDNEYSEAWIIKADSNGSEEWDKTFVQNTSVYSIQQTSDKGYILTGNNNNSVWLMKIFPENYSPDAGNKNKTPGFELILVVCGISLVLLLKRKRF